MSWIIERIDGLESHDVQLRALFLSVALDEMKFKGSSVTLNWGEDNDLWECSWITSGRRYVGFSTQKHLAVRIALIAYRDKTIPDSRRWCPHLGGLGPPFPMCEICQAQSAPVAPASDLA